MDIVLGDSGGDESYLYGWNSYFVLYSLPSQGFTSGSSAVSR